MAFWARNFIFDNISSEFHSLTISSDSDTESWNASGGVELKTETIYRRPVPFFYGVQHTPVLEIPLTVMTSETEITALKANLIQKWLFGQNNYKKLQILQCDMERYYFNCFLTSPEIIRIGNIIRGFKFTAVCDAPFGWAETVTETFVNPSTIKQTPTSDFLNNYSYTIYNQSDFSGYTYPILKVTTLDTNINNDVSSSNLGYFYVDNISDNNRRTGVNTPSYDSTKTYLGTKQYVKMDNSLQTFNVYDSSGIVPGNTNIFKNFNKKFFRLVPGYNELRLYGAIKQLDIEYTPAKRIS